MWDSVLFEYTGYGNTPFNDADWATISKNATILIDRYASKITAAEAKSTDPAEWAEESYKISEDLVYAEIKEQGTIPQDYIDKARPIAERQLVLAGMRLANLLSTFKLGAAKQAAFLQ